MSTHADRTTAERSAPTLAVVGGRGGASRAKTDSDRQREFISRLRAESCVDHNVPLGMSHWSRPDSGPSIHNYYVAKHERGERGTYWPLHRVSGRRRPS